MIAAIAAVFLSMVFFGGGLFMSHPLAGLWVGGTGAVIMGVLFAAIRTSTTSDVMEFELHPDGLEVGHLRDMPVDDDTLVFIMRSTTPSLVPAADTFQCLIDGKRVLVVEPMDQVPDDFCANEEELF